LNVPSPSQCQFQYDTVSDVLSIKCGHFVFKPLGGVIPLSPFTFKMVVTITLNFGLLSASGSARLEATQGLCPSGLAGR